MVIRAFMADEYSRSECESAAEGRDAEAGGGVEGKLESRGSGVEGAVREPWDEVEVVDMLRWLR
jgi:hypothetical protein